jgi:protocatechuate 3,4-dioxygenase beta subunit
MLRQNKLGLIVVIHLVLIAQGFARQNHSSRARLEGFVRDDTGKPVKGALIGVNQGSYITQGETAVIPLIFPKAAGAIILSDPDAINAHYIESHFAKTDSKGHFIFKKLPPGQYSFSVRGMKKYYGDFRTSERGLVPNKKLLDKYTFPDDTQIILTTGETAIKEIALHAKR